MAATLQTCCAGLGDSVRPRTDAELCLLRLCDESLCGDISGLAARVEKLEKAVESGVSISAKPAPHTPHSVAAPAEDERPPFPEEEPPLPEEPGARTFEAPVPIRPAAKPAAPAAEASGDSAVWTRLMDQYKGRLSVNFRAFLGMATGVLEGSTLTVQCPNDFVRTSLDNATVIGVLQEVTSADTGLDIRAVFSVGSAPAKKAPSSGASAPGKTAPAPQPKADAAGDALENLMNKGKGLAHFKIEE